MDINDLRSVSTLLAFVAFIAIVAWAYSGNRKSAFDEAAAIPLDDDPPGVSSGTAGHKHN